MYILSSRYQNEENQRLTYLYIVVFVVHDTGEGQRLDLREDSETAEMVDKNVRCFGHETFNHTESQQRSLVIVLLHHQKMINLR